MYIKWWNCSVYTKNTALSKSSTFTINLWIVYSNRWYKKKLRRLSHYPTVASRKFADQRTRSFAEIIARMNSLTDRRRVRVSRKLERGTLPRYGVRDTYFKTFEEYSWPQVSEFVARFELRSFSHTLRHGTLMAWTTCIV